jgi:hypothetical protein
MPGTDIEPSIMRQEVPKCDQCEAERSAAKAYRKMLSAGAKGKGRMAWDEEEDEDDDWGGGEPGIIKVIHL